MAELSSQWQPILPAAWLYTRHELPDGSTFVTGALPDEQRLSAAAFDSLWALHPPEYHVIMMHGRLVPTPRWQQAYGADYHYTGRVNKALSTPPMLQPLLQWATTTLDPRLSGVLLNWYEARLHHYIGPHCDSTKHMIVGSPVVTISFGEERVFRLRKDEGKGKNRRVVASRDFRAHDGAVFVMPWETNLAWKHGVPHYARYRGRRVSVTLRAFEENFR